MSTTVTSEDLDKPPSATQETRSVLPALLATLTALTASVLSVVDLFANGLGPTALHLSVGIVVFGVVRLCVGVALDPVFPPDDTESSA